MSEISLDEMELARKRTTQLLHRTPIMTSEHIDKIVGARVYFKCDHLQKTGSFKARGALNSAIVAQSNGAKGVITHSSGNHGQALAWAAQKCGLECVVVVPRNAPPAKIEAMRGYAATLVECESTCRAREETCAKLEKETGYTLVHPSNCATMINGHSSLALEILEQLDDSSIDSVFLSVGGGGLAASIAFCIGKVRPDIRVFLVEPEAKQLAHQLENGVGTIGDTLDTIADGVRVGHVVSLAAPILREYCARNVISVSEREIRDALSILWTRLKQRVEPTAALAFAGLAFHKPTDVKNAVVVLCGGNVDVEFRI